MSYHDIQNHPSFPETRTLEKEKRFTMAGGKNILTPEETAKYLKKSVSWVYKHAEELGGRKLGGSLFFPAEEDLYEFIFCKRKGVEVRLHPERKTVHKDLVQNQKGGQAGRSQAKGGNTKPGTYDDHRPDPNRHGLLGVGQ